MPYDVVRSGSSYSVIGPNGRVMGTHPTKEQAQQQQRALYSSEPDASKGEQPVKNSWQGLFFPRRG